MDDLNRALSDLGEIRQRMASNAMFRGFGPAVMAMTGLIAFATAAAQTIWPAVLASGPGLFLLVWTAAAVVAASLIAWETFARTRRHHGGLADAMLFNAVEHFLPVGAAGAVLAAVLVQSAPDTLWILPGAWSILVSLALFAAYRFLPRTVAIAAAWYFLAGTAALLYAADTRALEPWAMAACFGIGQLLLAAILKYAYGPEPVGPRSDDEPNGDCDG
ncbi:MAG: hypothetical protein AAFY27_07565 [Pseudomonadota bacterium]